MKLPGLGKAAWRSVALATLLAVPALMATAPAYAQTALPDGAGIPGFLVPSLNGQSVGTLLSTTETTDWLRDVNNTPTILATGRTAVFKNDQGYLDFYYQVFNEDVAAAGAQIHRFNISPFLATYTAAVGFRDDYGFGDFNGFFEGGSASKTASFVDRTGGAIGAYFFGTDSIGVTQSSRILVVKTNADATDPGSMQLINGGTLNVGSTVPRVPEPSALALALPGMLPLGFVMLRRRSRASAPASETEEPIV